MHHHPIGTKPTAPTQCRRRQAGARGARSPHGDDRWGSRSCNDRAIQHFIITIEGPGWEDFEDVELPRLPDQGEPIETKYGTCFVTHSEEQADAERYDGKIVCRLP
jgi:hypothetical protein